MLLFKNQQQIIAEIHNEFDAAQERLLQEAKSIINSYTANNKAERLKNLGFTASEIVVEHEEKIGVLVKNKEQADLIEYYKVMYPFQKFLTEDELNRICKKYNLIYAPISAYKKDVPEKNITEIEQAKTLKNEDAADDIKWCELKRDNSFCLLSGSGGSWCGIWGSEWYRIPKSLNGVHFHDNFSASEYLQAVHGFRTTYLINRVINHTQKRDGLFIAAPKSHFDLRGLKKQGEFGMNKTFSVVTPKDPIVFRYCKGGIQVLSKWGLEASDELVVNEKMN
jgi:hypothetical protein